LPRAILCAASSTATRRAGKNSKPPYYAELGQPAAQSAVRDLLDRLTHEPVTLLFAARDETRNNAVALQEWLDSQN
jgi:uncharacterized protein YeaO (DUF488 family)